MCKATVSMPAELLELAISEIASVHPRWFDSKEWLKELVAISATKRISCATDEFKCGNLNETFERDLVTFRDYGFSTARRSNHSRGL